MQGGEYAMNKLHFSTSLEGVWKVDYMEECENRGVNQVSVVEAI